MIERDRVADSKPFHYSEAVRVAQRVPLVTVRSDDRDSPLLVNPPESDQLILVGRKIIQKGKGDFTTETHAMK